MLMFDEEIYEWSLGEGADFLPAVQHIANVLLVVLMFIVGAALISGAISIVLWALRAVGVCKMSEKEKLKNPWYSFIPFFDAIAIGRLGAGYNKKNMAVTKNNSKALLVLQIILSVLAIIFVFAAIGLLIKGVAISEIENSGELSYSFFTSAGLFLLFYFAFIGVSIAYLVTYYICLYNIYLKFNRDNAVLFTVLGIFFSFLIPIFLFISSKNEPCYSDEEFRRKKLAKLNAMLAAQKAAQAAQAARVAQPIQDAAPAAPAEEVKEETSNEEIKEEKPEE